MNGGSTGQKAQHPEVSITCWPSRVMGQRPMQRSGTDPAFSPSRPLGVLDAAAAVRLPLLPIRALKNRYFFT